ncbi:MAG: hypothetical protein ACXVBW_11975, partial [Bdellovibrionota bacterium]
MRTSCRWLGLLGFLALLQAPSAHAIFTVVDRDDWKFQFGGFVELDTFYDSTRSLGEVPGNTPIARQGTFAGDSGRTTFSVRNSRVAFTLIPPVFDEFRTKGYVEFDFLNANPSSGIPTEAATFTAPAPRLRQAYFLLDRSGFTVLAGQFWSFLGWQPIYFLQTEYSQPVSGMLFERTPQITATYLAKLVPEKLELQAAISVERPAQRDSYMPNLDAGIRLAIPAVKSAFA